MPQLPVIDPEDDVWGAELNEVIRTEHNDDGSHKDAVTAVEANAAADARIAVQKAAANGLATLGPDSKIPNAQLPSLSLTEVHVVATEAAQLALAVDEGDFVVRTDQNRVYVHNGGTAGTMMDWTEIVSPTDGVQSVNGDAGPNITINADDIDDSATGNRFVTLDQITKLAGIEAGADVTDAANVTAAGAHMAGGTDIPIADGGTGASSASAARSNLGAAATANLTAHTGNTSNPHNTTKAQVGLGNADNTSDLAKPVSTATQTALDTKQAALGYTPVSVAGDTITGQLIIDRGTSTGANLYLPRNNASATNAILLQGFHPGGRVNVTWRDELGNNIVYMSAHGENDAGHLAGTPPHIEWYTSKADKVTMLPRFDIDSMVDWAVVGVMNGTLEAAGHDPEQTGMQVRRGTETTEYAQFNRPRSSSLGSNYFYRNLSDLDTNGPILFIHQDHASDNQPGLQVRQDGTGSILELLDGTGAIKMRVLSNSRMAVGASTPPSGQLHVFGTTNVPTAIVQAVAAQTANIGEWRTSDGVVVAAITPAGNLVLSGTVDGVDIATFKSNYDAHTHTLDGLSDVVLTSPAIGNVLKFDGTNWVNGVDATGEGGTGSVSSVNTQTGDVVLDADDIDDTATAQKFVTATDLTNLGNLSGTNTGDQDLSGYAVIAHDHDADYADIAHNHALNDLTDVLSITPPLYSFLVYDGTQWMPNTINQDDLPAHDHTAANVTDFDTEVANNTDVAANTAARHSHANKALLDTYTQTEANLADAVAKKHSHSNQATLDATTASFTTTKDTKLSGIATAATANSTDAALRDRATHTGAQAISTVTNLQTTLDAKAATANAKGFVNHGATAGTARPSGYASIEWLGSVEPTNMANGDTWVVTS